VTTATAPASPSASETLVAPPGAGKATRVPLVLMRAASAAASCGSAASIGLPIHRQGQGRR